MAAAGNAALTPAQLAERAMALSEAENIQLCPCKHCGRSFKSEALEKHEGLCVKVFQQKRKVFNTVEQRLPDGDDGVLQKVRKEAARQAKKGEVGLVVKAEDHKKSNWRQKSEAFRNAMKDAQIVTKFQKEGRPMSELPPTRATPAELDDRVPCPHCGRRFGQQQAERHIPLCKGSAAKAKPKAKSLAAAPGRNAPRQKRA